MTSSEEAIKAGVKAGLSVAESSVLGAFSVLCLGMAVVSVWLNYKTQNSRVADQKAMVDKMESLLREQGQFNTSTTVAIQKLNENEKQQLQVLTGIQTQLQSIIAGLMRG
jgi:hypothetical protein